jgi:hypothetical protein
MMMVCRVPRLTGAPEISIEAGIIPTKGSRDRRT